MIGHQGREIGDLFTSLKQQMEALQEENQQLRRQLERLQQKLADLKQGKGIVLMIDGQPVATTPNPNGPAFAPDVAPSHQPLVPYIPPAPERHPVMPPYPPVAQSPVYPVQQGKPPLGHPLSGQGQGRDGQSGQGNDRGPLNPNQFLT